MFVLLLRGADIGAGLLLTIFVSRTLSITRIESSDHWLLRDHLWLMLILLLDDGRCSTWITHGHSGPALDSIYALQLWLDFSGYLWDSHHLQTISWIQPIFWIRLKSVSTRTLEA